MPKEQNDELTERLHALNNKHGQPIAPATVNRRMAAISPVLTACTDERAGYLIERSGH